MWAVRNDPASPWACPEEPADADAIAASGLFGPPETRTASDRLVLPAESVLQIENTRSTALSWPPDVRRQFQAELAERLSGQPEVSLTRFSWATMARVAPRP